MTKAAAPGGWRVVAEQECRALWVGGRGPMLLFAFCVLLSVVTYLTASNQVLNFLEQRETVNLTLQVAMGVGSLAVMVVGADGVSGERERATLETLLLTPVGRGQIVLGKWVAALSLWLVLVVASMPYLWVLGRGVSVAGAAVALGLTVGTILAAALAAVGLLVSGLTGSNRVSLSVCLFVLLALFAPTQLPTGAQRGSFGALLVRVNPVASAEHYVGAVLVDRHRVLSDLSYLLSPVFTLVVAGAMLWIASDRLVQLQARGGVA